MVTRHRMIRKSLDGRPLKAQPGSGRNVDLHQQPYAAMASISAAFAPTEFGAANVRGTLRVMHADDASRYTEFLARVDARDLRLRFGRHMDASQPSELARLIPSGDDLVFVATVAAGGSECEIVGDARIRTDAHPYSTSAEFAIVVRSDLQRLGLGKALLEKLIEASRARGVNHLFGLVDSSNGAMLALARRLGFDVEYVPGGTTAVVSLELPARQTASSRRSAPETMLFESAGLSRSFTTLTWLP
jgi:ribosomal protein S18 acetylase RimI-like enzyme